MLNVVVLGAAAGGGFPQWNANDEPARRARMGDAMVRSRTQSSIAVSADQRRWVLLNASPDLRQQINERSQLHPAADGAKRNTPIACVVLTNADVDHVAGLLSLRENQRFVLYGHERVMAVLANNSVFNVLAPDVVERRALPVDQPLALTGAEGEALGLTLTAFVVPGKVALWLEDSRTDDFGSQPGDTIGLEVSADGGQSSLFYIPGCAEMSAELGARLREAKLVFFDGTLWRDDEMIRAGVGAKTGRRMGHMSLIGKGGTLEAFADLAVERKILIHINNTNPLLVDDSPERAQAQAAGWEVAYDGMAFAL